MFLAIFNGSLRYNVRVCVCVCGHLGKLCFAVFLFNIGQLFISKPNTNITESYHLLSGISWVIIGKQRNRKLKINI